MIQFRVNGEFLELPVGFDLGFMFTNSCFAFDKMQLNRTAEFTIPATPKNNYIFGFASDPSRNGDEVRRVYGNIEVYFDGGLINGNLRILKYQSGSGYSAMFSWGELSALKRLTESGEISTYFGEITGSILASNGSIIDAYHVQGVFNYVPFWFINYKNGVSDTDKLNGKMNFSPSISLSALMNFAAQILGVNINYSLYYDIVNSVGLILGGNKRLNDSETITFTGNAKDGINVSGNSSVYFQSSTASYKWQVASDYNFVLWWQTQEVHAFTALFDIIIKSPIDTDIVIVGNNENEFLSSHKSGYSNILSLTKDQEITLKKGQKFTIVRYSDWGGSVFNFGVQRWIQPFNTDIGNINIEFRYENASEVEVNTNYPIKPNLPKVTLTDIIKTFANLLHCGVDYNPDTNTISFFDFNFNKTNAKKLEGKVIDIKSIDRRFSDYAQENDVVYKSEEYVTSPSKITYTIDNQTLNDNKKLYTIPFNDGNIDVDGNVLVTDFDLSQNPVKKTAKQDTICLANPNVGGKYLQHITKLKDYATIPNTLDSIVNASTTVVATVLMSNKEFLQIKNTDCFEYRSVFYCCMDAKYKNGISEMTLVKI